MGLNIGLSSSRPRRAYYPSGPWVNEHNKPCKSPNESFNSESEKKSKSPNPDPHNYKLVRVEEKHGFLLVKIVYPDCTNYEGQKILLFKGVTLIDLVNQKYIDPHFFQSKEIHSPVARFVPTDEGWNMALSLINALKAK